MQGAGAAEEIANAIDSANAERRCDVLIVGRGGGSMEDLWAFNEPPVAEAIKRSAIPIISAVGHETDQSISDFVADLRAPTPSAAAELAVPEWDAIKGALQTAGERLDHALLNGLERKRDRLGLCWSDARRLRVFRALDQKRQALDDCRTAVERAAENAIEKHRHAVVTELERLRAYSPQRTLARGFAMIQDTHGVPVTTAKELKQGDAVAIRFYDGTVDASVTGKE